MKYIRKIIKRVKSLIPIIKRVVIIEAHRNDPRPSLEPPAGVSFEQVTAENVDLVLSFRKQEVVEQFQKYLAQGDIGMYAICDGHVVGHAWAAVAEEPGRLVWGYLPVTSDTSIFLFGSVDPEYRGRKIFQHILAELIKLIFRKTKVERIRADVHIKNAPSLGGCDRVGFRRICIMPLLHWRGRKIPLRKIPNTDPPRT